MKIVGVTDLSRFVVVYDRWYTGAIITCLDCPEWNVVEDIDGLTIPEVINAAISHRGEAHP